MNCSKRMKTKYERRLLGFILGVFFFGVLTGWGITAAYSAITGNFFPKEVQETVIFSCKTIQAVESSVSPSHFKVEAPETEELTEDVPLYSPEEVYAVALTLAGECYDNQSQDKRNVAWVICNRAKDGRFGEGVIGVVSCTENAVQFHGYWVQGRSVNDNDREIAEEVLAAYYAGDEPIHDYLYFTGGTGTTNNFR